MKKSLRIVLVVVFAAAVIYLLKFSPLSYYLFDNHGREIFMDKFSGYMAKLGPWAPFVFVLLYTLSIIFFIPASVFTSLGAIVFGQWYGMILNIIAANIGGILSFLVARYLLRDFTAKLLQKGRFKSFDDKVAEHGFAIMMYLRLMFIPFTYLNFAAGVSKIDFKSYFWSTFIGVIPGLAVITFFVGAIRDLILHYKQPADILRLDIIIPFLLFAFSFFIPAIVKRLRQKFFITDEFEQEIEQEIKGE